MTYSGSLLHNNRHLTQGSPNFTDSRTKREGGKKGGKERGGREGEVGEEPHLSHPPGPSPAE